MPYAHPLNALHKPLTQLTHTLYVPYTHCYAQPLHALHVPLMHLTCTPYMPYVHPLHALCALTPLG